jgi:DNA-damage-inducible protein J
MSLKDAVVKARIEPDLKRESEAILARLGMNTTDAIRMFFAQIRLQQGLPFSVRIPNAKTQSAIDELEAGQGDTTHE